MFVGDKEIFKKVKKVKLSTLLPKYNFPPGFDYAVVDENNKILNFCSSRYGLVSNASILKPIEQYFKEKNIEFTRNVKVINNSKFYVDYIIKQRKDVGDVSGIFPKISIWNSYDGGTIMRNEMGFYRLICSNGLTRPEGEITKSAFKHSTSDDSNKYSNQERIINIIREAKYFIDNCQTDIDKFEELSKVKITKRKITSIGEKVGLSKKIISCAEERYDLEVSSGLEYINEYGELVKSPGCNKNLFTLYNALNFGIYNTNLKELPEKKIEKDKKLLNHIMNI
jgi:hypothetical protein|tara:strand:- start:1369 stop:2214 length:846 start_codon:yes stop_codon:yes gene_type:complete